MAHRRGLIVTVLLAFVLALGVAVPAFAHTGTLKYAGSMTVLKAEPYRVKLANGTYTTYRATVKRAGVTHYFFSTAGTYADKYNEHPFSGPHKSSMGELKTFWGQGRVTMWNSRYYVEYKNINKSGSSTKIKVVSHVRYGYTGYAE